MKRVGFFKRIGKPTRMGNMVVKTGDIIKADYEFMMEQREGGWLYIKAPNAPIQQPRQQPTMVPKFEPEVIKTESVENLTKEENDVIKDVTNLYESIESQRKQEIEQARPQESTVVNIDKLKELKNLTNKEWFKITKEQAISILTEAGIDFSQVKKEKWELIKFIKKIIKDL